MSQPLENWSPEETRELAKLYCVHGETYRDIADELNKSPSAVGRAAKQIGIRGHKGDVARYIEMYEEDVSPLLRPVRFDTPDIAGTLDEGRKTSLTSVHWADLHIPFHDPKAENILFQILDDLKPDELYATGDILDFWQISTHRPPEERNLKPEEIDLQAQIDRTAAHYATALDIAEPDYAEARGGNHEDRFERTLLEMQANPRMRHLLHLTRVREALDLDYILGLKEQGWVTRKYGSTPTILRDKLVLVHGNRTNKWYTRSLLNRYGKSVMVFHVHRFQNYTKRDLRGQEAGFGVGCLCDLDPHYDQFPDWHQGFAVVDWSRSNSDRNDWRFHVEFVRIHDGETIFRGKHYVAE